jgi:hypothetical protein
VHQLRKKIEPTPAAPMYLLTESWAGYRLHVPSPAVERPATANTLAASQK